VVATGAVLVGGGAVVLRERFSASRFWDDVVRWDCTLFQYIGELCRYLVAAPPHSLERGHRLRLACGNGLRGDIWETFQNRFEIPRIVEFYAATESSFSLYNCEGKPGSIGRIPPFLAHRFPVAIVKTDLDTGETPRGTDGFCIRCAADDVGEAIGKLADSSGRFEGYTDVAASERKILRDVFEIGDAWYRTGDLMRKDQAGYFYFIDRLGDTFRWKGENVATSEVNDAIRDCPGVIDASTYGVTVPGADGRAGMAALVVDQSFDLGIFAKHLSRRLPVYALPVFVRFCQALDATETFKQKKQQLIREGFDPSVVGDPLFRRDSASGDYRPIERAVCAHITEVGSGSSIGSKSCFS
jgi:fatty-acyl-CoA synthase